MSRAGSTARGLGSLGVVDGGGILVGFREDLESIPVYVPGRSIDEIRRVYGIAELAKLASNESPHPPFPEVTRALADAAGGVHRYPDDEARDLRRDLAAGLGVEPEAVWVGAGSSQLLVSCALAVGGPGTEIVHATPSFVMYTIAARLAGAADVAVALEADHRHDLDGLLAAIGPQTRLVYVCNPNNPTGTIVPHDDLVAFLDRVPDDVLVVVDEAYHEYVTDPRHGTCVSLVADRPNLVVTRTFSKIHGLAGLRIGYAVGTPETIARLRRTQPPFATSTVAQAAARVSWSLRDRLAERIAENAAERRRIEATLAELGIPYSPSEANFVASYPDDPADLAERLLRRGLIVRALGAVLRITVGTKEENDRLIEALREEVTG
ncbi:MAG TPA: histidinol-phosphate transaminase [Actinobacteria bacterium]|nr:histidinol-phosphate transaminase [Actinomycetota bacterium]